jgi:hypothetical protein
VVVGLTVADPFNAGVPVPTAGRKLTLVAFVLVHVSVDAPPVVTVVGFAASVTAGATPVVVTVTVAVAVALPPVPVAVIV